MSIEKTLQERSNNSCELCSSTTNLSIYAVQPTNKHSDHHIYACGVCVEQIENPEKISSNHWRCLNESIWSVYPAVQVVAWRMLNRLKTEEWSQNLLDSMYMDDDTAEWAKVTVDIDNGTDTIVHKDSNGSLLQSGDTVVLIKDLDVKGANFTAKRGTALRNIILVADNADHIEGKVNGQQIVILTKYVKKA